MALQKMTHIEGLEAFEDVQLLNDTDPGANQAEFYLRGEEMPFLTAHPELIPAEEGHIAGNVYRKNFVCIKKTCNLGNSVVDRRIRDKVAFDKVSGKWRVLELNKSQSDIKRYSAEWNAFATNATEDSIGTPLSLLFKNDPARVLYYKSKFIHYIEQLSRCGESEIQQLGMGGREDVEKAKRFIARAEEAAPGLALASIVDAKDKEIAALQARMADLSDKLSQVLTQQIEAAGDYPKPRGKGKPKAKPLEETAEAA